MCGSTERALPFARASTERALPFAFGAPAWLACLGALLLACSGPDAPRVGAALVPAGPPAGPPVRGSRASPEEIPTPVAERAETSLPSSEDLAVLDGKQAASGPSARPCPGRDAVPAGMACVPGGTFVRGSDDGPPEERPAARVTVSTFLMDTHEVTNAGYRECVEARVCRRAMPFPGYTAPTQPAVAMRWEDADAYCRWRERRLPTEAEWERAASGPDDARYPWGDAASDPCEHAIVRVRGGRGCGRDVTWPVGSRAPNAWGLYDLAGNAWEWVADHHAPCYGGCARACGAACEGLDPRGLCGDPHAPCPAARGLRTVRGGSWWWALERASTTSRRGVPADNPNPHRFGFRCARDL